MQRFALDLRLMMPLQQRMRKCPQDKKCKYGDRTKLLVTAIGVMLVGGGCNGGSKCPSSIFVVQYVRIYFLATKLKMDKYKIQIFLKRLFGWCQHTHTKI